MIVLLWILFTQSLSPAASSIGCSGICGPPDEGFSAQWCFFVHGCLVFFDLLLLLLLLPPSFFMVPIVCFVLTVGIVGYAFVIAVPQDVHRKP